MDGAEKRFALLIDCDNIAPDYIDTILDELSKEGFATIRRGYGDWTTQAMSSWKKVLITSSITPHQQFANTKKKNATDSAMIIDAMDILYREPVDGFCLCSSDSDFTRLAQRLRESGKEVIGMGEEKTPEAFVQACTYFRFLDVIKASEKKKETPKATDQQKSEEKVDSAITPEAEIKEKISELIESSEDGVGTALSSTIGTELRKRYPSFDPRNYGCKKLIDLIVKLGFKATKDNAKIVVTLPAKNKSK